MNHMDIANRKNPKNITTRLATLLVIWYKNKLTTRYIKPGTKNSIPISNPVNFKEFKCRANVGAINPDEPVTKNYATNPKKLLELVNSLILLTSFNF